MLASIPQVESSQNLPRNPDNYTQQPSAEDLDAAQQLISSAQAGRGRPVDHSRDDSSARNADADGISQNGSTVHMEELKEEPKEEPREEPKEENAGRKTSPRPMRDASFLGHACRSV